MLFSAKSVLFSSLVLTSPAAPDRLTLNDGFWFLKVKYVVVVDERDVIPPPILPEDKPESFEQCFIAQSIFGLFITEDLCRIDIDRRVGNTVHWTANCELETGPVVVAGKVQVDDVTIKGHASGLGPHLRVNAEVSGQRLGNCAD